MIKDPFDTREFQQVDPFASDSKGIAGEVRDLFETAEDLKTQATFAKKNHDPEWLATVRHYANKLLDLAIDFFKKALSLAVSKFILELCAMTIMNLMETLGKKWGYKMDITTPGVAYVGDKPQQATSAGIGMSPFDLGSQSRYGAISSW